MPTQLPLFRSDCTSTGRSRPETANRHRRWGVAICFCGWFVAAATAAEPRTWTDATGKFKIQAEFVSEQNGSVTLRQTDGSEVEIPINKLSKPDQDYLKTQRDSPFQPKTASPFQPRNTPAAGAAAPPAATGRGVIDDSGAFESRLVRVNAASVTPLNLFNSGEGWKVEVVNLQGGEVPDFSGKPIQLPPKTGFHEKPTGLVFNAGGTHAALGYKLDFPQGTAQTRLMLVDLKSGKQLANRTTGGLLGPLALADDHETIIMCRNEFGFGNADRLEIWKFGAGGLEKGAAWIPYDSEKNSDRDVIWADFTAGGQLLTINSGGLLTAWTTDPVQPVWSCQAAKGCRPALSPNRTHLVLADADQVCLLDVANPRVVASRALKTGAFPKFSFSPSGARFAATTQSGSMVWETATGETYRDLESTLLPAIGSPEPPLFVNEEQVLIGDTYLVDLPSMIPLWDYGGADVVSHVGSAVWYAVADGDKRPGVLFGAKLPHAAVDQALKRALSDPNFFIVKPGTAVKLNLDALPDAEQREAVRQALTDKLSQREMRVDPSAEVQIVATFDPPKSKNLTFHGFGGIQSVDFNETVAHISIQWQGQTLWQMQGSNSPHFLSRKEGESLQDAAKRHEAPPYDFFKHAGLPRMLVRPGNGGGRMLGSSRVTTTGIR